MKMKPLFALAFACISEVRAEEASTDITGLQKAAADFVTAYNNRDAAAIAALFVEEGEIADITGTKLTSARSEIQARYEEIFAGVPGLIAVEVLSVRIIAPNLAIEDGTVHLTPAADHEFPLRSANYSAVLMKNAENIWQIASTRDLTDVTSTAGHLAALADTLKGEWTSRSSDGVQLDLAFGWDPTGKFLAGETLASTADSEPQTGTIRIGWNAAKKSIVSSIFDAKGGVTHGVWTPAADGWLVRSEGTTAEGETIVANQKLTVAGDHSLIWSAMNQVVDGVLQPDTSLHIVRRAPEPLEDLLLAF